MHTDTFLMLCLAVLGIADVWLYRLTDRGILDRAQALIDRLTGYRWARGRD